MQRAGFISIPFPSQQRCCSECTLCAARPGRADADPESGSAVGPSGHSLGSMSCEAIESVGSNPYNHNTCFNTSICPGRALFTIIHTDFRNQENSRIPSAQLCRFCSGMKSSSKGSNKGRCEAIESVHSSPYHHNKSIHNSIRPDRALITIIHTHFTFKIKSPMPSCINVSEG